MLSCALDSPWKIIEAKHINLFKIYLLPLEKKWNSGESKLIKFYYFVVMNVENKSEYLHIRALLKLFVLPCT